MEKNRVIGLLLVAMLSGVGGYAIGQHDIGAGGLKHPKEVLLSDVMPLQVMQQAMSAIAASEIHQNNIKINQRSIGHGNSIVITNGRIVVDGQDVTGGDEKVFKIEVAGNVKEISADACDTITVTGSAGPISTQSGSVHTGDVSGSVNTMSGSVAAGKIGGSVSTMSGDIVSR